MHPGTRHHGTPNFENLRRTLFRQGEPGYVPIVEFGIDRDVKNAFLGRPVQNLKDEVEFWVRAGYDFVPMQAGIRSVIRPGHSAADKAPAADVQHLLLRKAQSAYSLYSEETQTMDWAEERKGVISTMEEFSVFPGPTRTRWTSRSSRRSGNTFRQA